MKKLMAITLLMGTSVFANTSAEQKLQAQVAVTQKVIAMAEKEVALAKSEYSKEKAELILKLRELDLAMIQGADKKNDFVETVNAYNQLKLNKLIELEEKGYASKKEVLLQEFKLVNSVPPSLGIPFSIYYAR